METGTKESIPQTQKASSCAGGVAIGSELSSSVGASRVTAVILTLIEDGISGAVW
jgi:hypothetical protein